MIEQRAQALAVREFKALDALHIAAAEAAEVDYFCTCGDRLLKKAQTLTDSAIKIVSPLGLAQEVVS
jgi:predicted nucleic acid-binding protein